MENNFSKQALSHIPFDIFQSMGKETAITESDMQKLQEKVHKHGPALYANPESIRPNIPKEEQLPDTPKILAPIRAQPKPATMSYAIEGHVIEVPLDSTGAAIQMFYTLLAFVWGKDKKVAKILKQFDFKFYDVNGVMIYPAKKKK